MFSKANLRWHWRYALLAVSSVRARNNEISRFLAGASSIGARTDITTKFFQLRAGHFSDAGFSSKLFIFCSFLLLRDESFWCRVAGASSSSTSSNIIVLFGTAAWRGRRVWRMMFIIFEATNQQRPINFSFTDVASGNTIAGPSFAFRCAPLPDRRRYRQIPRRGEALRAADTISAGLIRARVRHCYDAYVRSGRCRMESWPLYYRLWRRRVERWNFPTLGRPSNLPLNP